MKKERKMRPLVWAAGILILAAAVCFGIVTLEIGQPVIQSSMTIPVPVEVEGEYSRNGTDWIPLEEDSDLFVFDGMIRIRCHFSMEMPQGGRIYFYRDHITAELYVNGEPVGCNSVVDWMKAGYRLSPSMCGKYWQFFESPGITPSDEVEIRLYNYHKFGNRNAVREFLKTLCVTPNDSSVLETALRPWCRPFQMAGAFVIIAGLMILGAAGISTFMKIPIAGRLWNYALLCLFYGGFFWFDTMFLETSKVALHTYGNIICRMLGVLWLGACIRDSLGGRKKKAAGAALMISGAVDMVLLILSCMGGMVIYDTVFFWMIQAGIFVLMQMIFILTEPGKRKKEHPLSLFSGLLLCLALFLDFFGVGRKVYSTGTCSKAAFFLVFCCYLVYTVIYVIQNHQASLRVEKLEKDLEESRISIMLSQLQPHFLYNVLNSIYYLCEKDPKTA